MMKTIPILVALVIACLAWLGCVVQPIRGSGTAVKQTREVTDFKSIEFSGQGELALTQGRECGLTLTADDNLIDLFKTSVEAGVLKIELKTEPREVIRPETPIVFEISFVDLNEIDVSGAGTIKCPALQGEKLTLRTSGAAQMNLRVEVASLVAKISGAADVTVSGKADDQNLTITGAATWRSRDLSSRTGSVNLSGTGSAVINASEALNIKISGVGSVTYLGDPEITQQISGMGTVKRQN